MTVADVAQALVRLDVRGSANERDVQAAIAAALDRAGLAYQREVPIVGGRIDFMVGNTGIEVKVKGSLSDLTRQVSAYTDEPGLDAIIVASTRLAHQRLPERLGGKAVIVMWLGAGGL